VECYIHLNPLKTKVVRTSRWRIVRYKGARDYAGRQTAFAGQGKKFALLMSGKKIGYDWNRDCKKFGLLQPAVRKAVHRGERSILDNKLSLVSKKDYYIFMTVPLVPL
jgi:hypothetical protein